MRLDKVSIDGFKNLKQLEVDFDERQLTTVLIGQNGAGKSNLIEAITQVFRWADLRRNEPRFRYRVAYRIQPLGRTVPEPPCVCLSNFPGEPAICVNGKEVKRPEFERRKSGALASEFLATQLPIDGQLNQLRRLTRPSEPYAAAARAQLRISGFGDLCEPVEQMEAAA